MKLKPAFCPKCNLGMHWSIYEDRLVCMSCGQEIFVEGDLKKSIKNLVKQINAISPNHPGIKVG